MFWGSNQQLSAPQPRPQQAELPPPSLTISPLNSQYGRRSAPSPPRTTSRTLRDSPRPALVQCPHPGVGRNVLAARSGHSLTCPISPQGRSCAACSGKSPATSGTWETSPRWPTPRWWRISSRTDATRRSEQGPSGRRRRGFPTPANRDTCGRKHRQRAAELPLLSPRRIRASSLSHELPPRPPRSSAFSRYARPPRSPQCPLWSPSTNDST